ncbi:BON domain-containing protein [Burkholderia gladioli]|uniref:Transport-associated protein n=1 Tax=Burkholderia gladioli (strain BSR3) TaxID=999541 RepID=F2L9P3_BURGS|nr:BON domain-containing protein [Burkholderia gladioli]AEA60040.1 Transport-associated protein [Burkholderia gladioli BSR3]MBW5286126.1 BON domain-containing protein [Burkholderia gladioli]
MKHRNADRISSTPRRLARSRGPRGLLAVALTAATAFCASVPFDAGADTGDTVASATHSATHSAGAKMRDMAVTTKAKAALVQASGLSSDDVHVSTRQGHVTLTGSVPDESQRPLAVAAVKSVDGVRSVQDQLTIHPK